MVIVKFFFPLIIFQVSPNQMQICDRITAMPPHVRNRICDYIGMKYFLDNNFVHEAKAIYRRNNRILFHYMCEQNLKVVHFILYTYYERHSEKVLNILKTALDKNQSEIVEWILEMNYFNINDERFINYCHPVLWRHFSRYAWSSFVDSPDVQSLYNKLSGNNQYIELTTKLEEILKLNLRYRTMIQQNNYIQS